MSIAAALSGRRILITGDTGFKGVWLCRLAHKMGADVIGVGLPLDTEPCLFNLMDGPSFVSHHEKDIRDREALKSLVAESRPDIVVHMAAQSLVRRSYREPYETFSTNVMGTVSLLEALFEADSMPAATLIITSDKVYRNDETGTAYAEDMALGGGDPYSASKAATEYVVAAMRSIRPTFSPIATARAGNVIGGGDWAEDRLVPDLYRALVNGETVSLRYPNAVRPWQHVLDVLAGYLEYIALMIQSPGKFPPCLNFGPGEDITLSTVREIVESLGSIMAGTKDVWTADETEQPKEMAVLRLNAALAGSALQWRPRLSQSETIDWTADWYLGFRNDQPALSLVDDQIDKYLSTKWAAR